MHSSSFNTDIFFGGDDSSTCIRIYDNIKTKVTCS
jgi:hypothetical protein